MRNYTIKKAPGATLQYYHRATLQKDWNDRIENGSMPTLRAFARDHGLAVQTWKTDMQRKACGSHPQNFHVPCTNANEARAEAQSRLKSNPGAFCLAK